MWKVRLKPLVIVTKNDEMVCGQADVEFEFDNLEDAVKFSELAINHSADISSFEIRKE